MKIVVLCFFAIINRSKTFIQNPKLQVRIPNGIIQGTEHSNPSFYSFQGIPYAQPPVGRNRFRAPIEPLAWSGVLDGGRAVPSCIQIPQRGRDWYESEDCLYLNVFTPQAPWETVRLRPVMVWIYGGAFLWGVANSNYYGPEYLVAKDVVVVHFNYRVNIFGFLSTEDMSAPGNYGLKDQLQALRWVNQNIAQFGGDPGKVTIFGESAGGASVQYHLLSRQSEGLFRAAIVESGSVLCPWALQTNPLSIAKQVAEVTGFVLANTRLLVEHLRKLDVRTLTRATLSTVLLNAINVTKGLPFSPSLEPEHAGAFLTIRSHQLLSSGDDFKPVPLVIGFNSQESAGAQTALQFGEPLLRMVSTLNPIDFLIPPGLNPAYSDVETISDAIKSFYFSSEGTTYKQYLDFISDSYFYRPIMESARLYATHAPTFLYRFSFDGYELGKKAFALNKNSEVQGVQHAEEVWYIFGRSDLDNPTDQDEVIRNRMVTMWTNFAKYSLPTPFPDPLLQNLSWPAFLSPDWFYLDIGNDLTVETRFKDEMVRFWDDLFRKYGRPPYDTY